MLGISEAIKLAVEKGGYKGINVPDYGSKKNNDEVWDRVFAEFVERPQVIAQTLLDPLFWQALGKALNWEEQFGDYSKAETKRLLDKGALIPHWQYYAHKYLSIKLTAEITTDSESPEEKFWKELLT